jgi:hypothetical protein
LCFARAATRSLFGPVDAPIVTCLPIMPVTARFPALRCSASTQSVEGGVADSTGASPTLSPSARPGRRMSRSNDVGATLSHGDVKRHRENFLCVVELAAGPPPRSRASAG